VRDGPGLQTRQLESRLSYEAFVEELELINGRLRYKLVSGSGPETGWVSTRLYGKDLLRPFILMREDLAKPAKGALAGLVKPGQQPLFCAWYSGGFAPKDGEKLLEPLLQAVKNAGVKDVAVFHFPDAYEMTGEGREPWATYVDLLVREINKAAGSKHRPLILFGHSRGAAPATCVAYRLGSRVKKVYIAACGAMRSNEPTGWELLSKSFKEGGDRDLLQWFSGIQPGNILLHRAAFETSNKEFEEQIQSSKFLSDMLDVMRSQYRDAMYPDPDRDFGKMAVPIMAFSPSLDESCQPEHCEAWGLLTSGGFQLESLDAGHMDCLQPSQEVASIPSLLDVHCPFVAEDEATRDILRSFAKVQARQLAKGKGELFQKICKDLQQFLP